MSDRELIERSAKAYADPLITPGFPEFSRWIGRNEDMGCDVFVNWNPLHDDGDALRLAVKLNIDIFQSTQYREAQAGGRLPKTIFEPWGADKGAATRRAIVRAAAEIGRAMP